jgi:uncharacterized protein (TIGR01244 family)
MDLRRLDDHASVAGQVWPEDLPSLVAAGFRTIVNNRPDGEQPGQPAAAEIEAAAQAAGLGYHHIPVAGGFSQAQVDAMTSALASGPVLAFCASGTRSTFLWALARAQAGDDPAELGAKAASAGYDLRPIQRWLAG